MSEIEWQQVDQACPHPDDDLAVGVKGGFVLLRCSRCESLLLTRPATSYEAWAWKQLGEAPEGRA
nr:hypothetical protein [Candidatus Binatia bacterium]